MDNGSIIPNCHFEFKAKAYDMQYVLSSYPQYRISQRLKELSEAKIWRREEFAEVIESLLVVRRLRRGNGILRTLFMVGGGLLTLTGDIRGW